MVNSQEMVLWLKRATAVVVLISLALIAASIYLKKNGIWPELMPFDPLYFWLMPNGVWIGIREFALSFWWAPPLLWGGLLTGYVSAVSRNDPVDNARAEAHLSEGAAVSFHAGFLEEIVFRWTVFLGYIVFMVMVNYAVAYGTGIEVLRLIYQYGFEPVADVFTLGFLKQVSSAHGWAVGAAMLAANGSFRDGHVTNGTAGWINSWFMGMYFFWVMLTFGLLSAIIIHFVYDLVIFFVRYVDMVLERSSANRTST